MIQTFARRTVRKELTRKEMLALGLLSGAALFLPLERRARTQLAVDLLPAAAVPLWEADLAERFPPVARPVGKRGLTDYYKITQKKALQQILPDGLPETEVWGYDGIAPGPTFVQRVGRKTVVRQINDTGDRHTSTHLHGNATPPQWDGYAPDMTNSGQFKDYRYPNNQDARTLWYHDHGMHETGENAYMGLAGFYITHDDLEDSLHLPTGDYDIPLLIQDKAFTTDGSLFYDISTGNNLLGNIILVNGVPWPRLRVEPRKYVFRILNGSISRGYNLRLSTGGTMTVVGHDGGVDPTPSPITSFRIGPAERYEIVVDFSPYASTPGGPDNPVILENLGVPNAPADAQTTGQIIRFDVGSRVTDDTNNGPVPSTLNPGNHAYSPMKLADPGRTDRQFIFERGGGASAPWVIAVGPDGPGLNFDENRVDANPELDAVEVWEFTNNSGGWFHPIHTHLIDFKILSRTGGDAPTANNGVHPWEGGPKDVTYVGEGESVRVIAKFGPQKGKYLMHCHNLIHEDHDMMTQFEVGSGGPDPVSTDPARPISQAGPLVPPNVVPVVIPISPPRGSRTRRRRPLIRARVLDAESPLTTANMELRIDGRPRGGFTYDPGTKLLSFRPSAGLPPGRHTVRVRANDPDGGNTTKEWGFTIVR